MPRTRLLELLESYSARTLDPHERATAEEILGFVRVNPRCADRKLTSGHLTGSAWIVDFQGECTLLTHHTKLEKWLQLGGHADGDLDLLSVALREAREESGLASLRSLGPEIFDVDKHWIPERRSDPGHWHYDLRFLFEADPGEPLVVTSESKDLAWICLDQVHLLNSEESVLRMVRKSAARK